jgi:hypothetical protein
MDGICDIKTKEATSIGSDAQKLQISRKGLACAECIPYQRNMRFSHILWWWMAIQKFLLVLEKVHYGENDVASDLAHLVPANSAKGLYAC